MPAYPVPPGRRIAYDADGSQGFQYNTGTGVAFPYTTAMLKAWNGDLSGVLEDGNSTYFFGSRPGVFLYEYLFFPGPRDLTHLGVWMTNFDGANVAYSTDALTPGTGSWTTVGGLTLGHAATATEYRTFPVAVAASSVVALRLSWDPVDGNRFVGRLHVYGKRSASDTARQVAFVDSTGARLTTDFDYEDVGQGATTLKWKSPTLFSASDQLYVKNFGSQIANSIVVTAEVSGNDTGNFTKLPTETAFSLDDVTYTVTETISTLAAGASVGPLFVQYSPLGTDPVSLGIGRAKIAVGSWT